MQVLEYIGDSMPGESAVAFGLHPNAEIGFKLREAESFCSSLLSMQPREAGGDGTLSVEERAKQVLDAVMDYGLALQLGNCTSHLWQERRMCILLP